MGACSDEKYIVNLHIKVEVFILNNEMAWKDYNCNFDLKECMAGNTA